MRKSFLPLMLASVALPFSAFAQDAPASPDTSTPPAASDSATPAPDAGSSDTATPAPDAGASDSAQAPMDSGSTDAPASGDAMSTDTAPSDTGTSTGDAGSTGDTGNAMDSTDSSSADSADAPAGDSASAASGSEETFVTVPPTGAWRVTDLDGKDVYGSSGESIGSISDVLVSENGDVMAVLVGVGGFLGIGQKDVAVSMTALEFGPGKTEGLKTESEADAETASSTAPAGGTAGGMSPDPSAGGAGAGGTAGAPAAEDTEPVVGEDNLPDRIVLNVTREELEQAPAYGEPEGSGDSAGGDAMSTGTAPAGGSGMGTAPAGGQPAAQ